MISEPCSRGPSSKTNETLSTPLIKTTINEHLLVIAIRDASAHEILMDFFSVPKLISLLEIGIFSLDTYQHVLDLAQ